MKKWRVTLTDREEVVEADSYHRGTDFVQFFKDGTNWPFGRELAAYPSREVASIEEIIGDDGEPELLAEVRSEGEADVPTPTRPGDADAKPRKSPRKVPQRSGKVSRL